MELNEAVYNLKVETLEKRIKELELHLQELKKKESDVFLSLEIMQVVTLLICKQIELRNLKDIVH